MLAAKDLLASERDKVAEGLAHYPEGGEPTSADLRFLDGLSHAWSTVFHRTDARGQQPPVSGHFVGGLVTDSDRGGNRFVADEVPLSVDDHVRVIEFGVPYYGQTGRVIGVTPDTVVVRFSDGGELTARPDEVRREVAP